MHDSTYIPEGCGVELQDGGIVSVTGSDGCVAPGRLGCLPDGVAFGPVAFALATDDRSETIDEDDTPVLALDRLEWVPEDESPDGAWLFGAAIVGAGGITLAENPHVSRRSVIATGALIGLAAIGSTTATADEEDDDEDDTEDDHDDLVIAKAQVSRADVPYWVGVLDVIERALPWSSEIDIVVDGRRVETADQIYSHEGSGETLGSDTTGDVEVRLRDATKYRDRALAYVRGLIASGNEIELTYKLPAVAADLEETQQITTNRAVVGAADDASTSVVTIGDDSIPHTSERWGHDRGSYGISRVDGVRSLVYEPGDSAPASDRMTVRFDAGRISSIRDSFSRL